MRSVHKRPGSFAIFVPSPGLLLIEGFLLWQALSALGRPSSGVVSGTQEATLWASLATAAALLGLMLRWGDRIERSRSLKRQK